MPFVCRACPLARDYLGLDVGGQKLESELRSEVSSGEPPAQTAEAGMIELHNFLGPACHDSHAAFQHLHCI